MVLTDRIWTPSTPLNAIVDLADQFSIKGSPSGHAVLATYSAAMALAVHVRRACEGIAGQLGNL